MTYRRRAVAALVALALLGPAVAAGADTLRVDDGAGDVRSSETEALVTEPRVDITAVDVSNDATRLEVTVTVAQLTPLDDDAWNGSLTLDVGLLDADGFPWFWSFVPDGGGGATGVLVAVTDDGVFACDTSASVRSVRRQYVLTADQDCVRRLSPSVRVGVAMSYDEDPLDDDFDVPFDVAPDLDYTEPISIPEPTVTRLAGVDRIATAVLLSADRFEDGAAPAAVLVASTADDAAPAGPLAASVAGPLLLTAGDHLDERVRTELQRAVELGGDVLLVGGTAALSDGIVGEVRALGLRPRRVAGADRFATAVAVAEHVGEHGITLVADARRRDESLVAGAAAAAVGGVVVLSDGGTLPPSTDEYLAADAARHVAIGGAAAAAPGAERITATSTAELSQQVLDRLLPTVRTIAVAAVGSADALAGAPHIAGWEGGLLLTDGAELSSPVAAELTQRADALREVVLYGGTGALSPRVADAVTAAVR